MDFVKNVVCPCVGPILGFLVEPVCTHGAYAFQYKNHVQQLEQANNRLRGKKERIQGMVDIETNYGKVIETEVSNWLEEVKQMEGDIANFLRQPGDGESFRCFQGCMCPNLMWRYKRGMEAEKKKSEVSELISRGALLQTSPVARDASFEPVFDSSLYYTTFQSRASVVDEIRNALKDSGVDMIGVHGPGGAGKTTMVKEVAKEAKELRNFDKIVIAVVSKEPNTSKLQQELASQLDLNSEQISESVRADKLRKALLNGKRKILVILDDLWQVLGLNAIGIPTSGLGDKGCKILLTSRDEEVFRRMEVRSCFRIGYLQEQETWKLFTKVIAGDFGVDESIARKVSKRCGGLPIAIVAVGAALKGKEEAEWQDALYQLENCPLKYIEGSEPVGYSPLKWSYDFLKDEDAKSCFLLCCLFPEDAEISIDDLVRYSFALGFLRKVATLKDARNRVQAKVNMLKSSCLLLNGVDKNFVKMHDVIRDLAISITEKKQIEHEGGHDWAGQQQFKVDHDIQKWKKNDDWEHHTAISLRINNDNIHFPSGKLHCPLMHTLVLELGNWSRLIIPSDFFQGMKEARVLDLKFIQKDIPSSVLELDQLQMLCLNYCQLGRDLSIIQNLKNHIEILSFKGCEIEELPQEIGKLTRLRSLDLRDCDLKVIPKGVISNLIHLEELYVSRWFTYWDTTTIYGGGMSNVSIAELKSLHQLTVLHINILTNSYRIMAQECRYVFEKLIHFFICVHDYGVGSLNELRICDIHDIDGFHLLMDKVEILLLSNIQDLRYLGNNPQLQVTSSGGGSFSKLIQLDIYKCQSMKYLFSPSWTKALQQLKRLAVRDCSIMERIIGVGDHLNEEEVADNEAIIFNRLEVISLSELPQFKSFGPKMEKITIEENFSNQTTTAESIFNEKVSFPVLEKLTINELPSEAIWNEQTIQSPNGSNKISFSQLRHIEVTRCHKLANVFRSNMLLGLQNLETLHVEKCSSLTLLVEILNLNKQSHTVKFKLTNVFPKLRDLKLDGLPKLKKIWPNDEDYCSNDNYVHLYLKSISISHCGSLRHVFSAFVARHLACIEDLHVRACPRMEVIVSEASREGVIDDGIIEFCQLKRLELIDLSNLKSFSQSKSEASHLFNQVSFPVLEELTIKKLPTEDIWNEQTIQSPNGSNKISFSQLRYIDITQCHKLANVFRSNMLLRLQNLETLYVEKCSSLTLLVEILNLNKQSYTVKFKLTDVFPKLRHLKLDGLPKLKKIWPNDKDYCSNDNYVHLYLKSILISHCGSLRHVFSAFVARHLACIEDLHVRACPRMEVIVSEASREGVIDDNIIEFCQLKGLDLIDLSNLKNFSQSKSEASHLFNQVIFPKIKYVTLSGLKSSREIQLWDLLAITQEHLYVKIIRCQVSTKVSSHLQKRSSRMIFNNLILRDCQGFKHVIDLNGTISIGEKQFVNVKNLVLYNLRELVHQWNKNSYEIGGLIRIIIENCSQLKSLFTVSMAITFQHLEMLSVESCEMMEDIIIIEKNNNNFAGEEKATLCIEFPKLKKLILYGLPNLKNFCNDERGSFSFSSLRSIQVERCPKMKTFASGQICLSPIEWGEVEITDLNAYFESSNEDNNYMIINCKDDSHESEHDLYEDILSDESEYDSYVGISSEDD